MLLIEAEHEAGEGGHAAPRHRRRSGDQRRRRNLGGGGGRRSAARPRTSDFHAGWPCPRAPAGPRAVLGGRRTVGVAALDGGRATAPPEATGAGRRSRPRVMPWVAARLEGNSPESRTRVGGLPRQGIPAGGATAAPAGQEVATAMRVTLLEGTHLILSGRWIADPTAAPFLGDVARLGAREWLDGGRAFVFGDSAVS